jgi:signal transduction histidine kinase
MLGLSRAPGWARARLFAPVALSAATYSLLDLPGSMAGVSDGLRVAASTGGYLAASLHCASWIPFLTGNPDERCFGLDRRGCALMAITVALGVASLVPGWAVSTDHFHDVRVPALGLAYRNPFSTTFGDLVGTWFLAVLLWPFVAYARLAWAGDRGARVELAAFVLFFACSVNEVLVMNGVVGSIYLADFGFLSIVLAAGASTVRKITDDARTLAILTRSLESEVETRTRERNDARGALLEAERLATLGRLARGVGHEINNPLTYVHTNIDFVRDHLGGTGASEELVHALDDAIEGTQQIEAIIGELQAYARQRDGEQRRLGLSQVAHGALALVSAEVRRAGHVVEDYGPAPTIRGDRVRLTQMLITLLIEAAQSMERVGRRGTITIRTSANANGDAVLEVVDEGEGLSKHRVGRARDPFAREGDDGRGGLGWHVVETIVAAHGGLLELESVPGKGTSARIVLPKGEGDVSPDLHAPGPTEPDRPGLGDRARFLSLRASRPGHRALRS